MLEAGAAGDRVNRPILKTKIKKAIVDFDMDEDDGNGCQDDQNDYDEINY